MKGYFQGVGKSERETETNIGTETQQDSTSHTFWQPTNWACGTFRTSSFPETEE